LNVAILGFQIYGRIYVKLILKTLYQR
jgi:hypothetical protein